MDKATARALGKRAAALRARVGLTQEQVAERIRCSPSHVARFESGTREMSLGLLYKLSAALESTMPRLFADERALAAESEARWRGPCAELATTATELADADVQLLLRIAHRLRK